MPSENEKSKAQTLARIERAGVIAVLRASSTERAITAANALIDAGITAIEVTFTVPSATQVIRALREQHGDTVVVGAGTVVTGQQVAEAVSAGAEFLVSPGNAREVTAQAVATGVPTMIGAFTASEVMAVLESGADIVKFFPGGLAGPAGIRALKGPFPEARFVPTGGVSAANLGEWFAAGAIAVGAGGELLPSAAVETSDIEAIHMSARAFLAALQGK